MISSSFRVLALLPFLLPAAQAANDWKVPCFNGVCEYDLVGKNTASGNLRIWGGADSITDITPAANWEILDCDTGKLDQDIRLVCKDDEDNSGCSHLYQSIGAVGKIVRLPETCGESAFARISRAWVHEDQSIPSNIAKRLVRRDGAPPLVKGLHIDTNFHLADASKTGPVNIAFTASNLPGTVPVAGSKGSKIVTRRRLGKAARRGIFDTIKDTAGGVIDAGKEAAEKAKQEAEEKAKQAAEAAQKAKDEVEKKAKEAADKAKEVKDDAEKKAKEAADKAKEVADKAKDKAGEVIDKAKDTVTKDIKVDKTIDLPPISLDKSFNLVNAFISCGPLDAGVTVDVNSQGEARVSVGAIATGTLVPPKFDDFQLLAGLSADIDGEIVMTGDVSGFLDTGRIKIFQIGVPGLTIPGILAVGPTLEIAARASADLVVNYDMTVGFKYKVDDAKLFFPPKDQKSGGNFTIQDTPLKLSAGNPNIDGSGSVEAHLIPGLNFGISALGNVAKAQVFLDVDAKAVLNLDFAKREDPVEEETEEDGEVTEDGEVLEEDGEVTEGDEEVTEDGEVLEDDETVEGDETGDGTATEDDTEAAAETATVTVTQSDATTTITVAPKATKAAGVKRAAGDVTATVTKVDAKATPTAGTTGEETDETVTEDGTVNGEVLETDGEVTEDGEVLEEDGEAAEDGEVLEDDGEVTEDGEVLEDDETVDGAEETGETTKTKGSCVNIKAGIDVNAGARGSFFNIFNQQTTVPLFKKEFQLFKKCFGDDVSTVEDTTGAETTDAETTDAETAEDETVAEDETTEDETVPRRRRRNIVVTLGRRREMRRLAIRQETTTTTGSGRTSVLSSGLSCLKQLLPVNPLTSGNVLASQITPF